MNQSKQPLRVAIVGTSARSDYLYGPILKALSEEVELVSIWGRSADSARRLGESLEAPWYTDLDRLIQETEPEIGIVSVAYDANGQVGLMAVEHGLHVLLETDAYCSQVERGRCHHRRSRPTGLENRGRRAIPSPALGANQAQVD